MPTTTYDGDVNFAQELEKLNPKQRAAVEAIEGPVMVVAGPGTGKTQILTLRIANILQKTDTPPASILALTFTESAVVSMKQRLLDIIGATAYQVSIKTIHGFCNEVIQEHPEAFPEISGGANVTEVEQIKIIRELLDLGKFELLRSFGDPYRSVRDILGAISDLKREGKSPADFAKLVKLEQKDFDAEPDLYHEKGAYKGQMKGKYQTQQKRIERHEELVALYESYQKVLQKGRQYDYDDMILAVAQVLRRDKDLRFILQEKYLYILVDEHQDTNQSQNEVIELLASFHDNPNLFVVGDAKQAIYRFQGASLENFAYFKEQFKGAQVITLTDNYRSTQTILDAALDLALGEGALKANAKHPKKHISIMACETSEVEPYLVALHIQERLNPSPAKAGTPFRKGRMQTGAKPEEIAVLYRNNKDAAPIARYLEKLGVPYAISADDDALDDPGVKKLLMLLQAVQNFGKDYALVPLLYLDFLKVAPLDVMTLIDVAREQRVSVFQLIRDPKTLRKVIPESAEKVFALYEKLSLWKAMSKSFSLLPMFEAVVRESGLLTSLVEGQQGPAALSKINALLDELKDLIVKNRSATLDDFLEQLEIMREHRVRIKSSVAASQPSVVRLMTAHKSKGQEFEYVYIVGATHQHWEGKRDRDMIKLPESVFSRSSAPSVIPKPRDLQQAPVPESDADERNLFYVALTRAKKELVISYGQKNAEGADQLPSEFLAAIHPELVSFIPVPSVIPKPRDLQQALSLLEFAAPTQNTPDLQESQFLRQRFLEKGLSVSALNNYLECPTKFYFLNLVGMREAPSPSGQAGNAAHGALKYAVERKALGESVTKSQFLNRFAYLLSKEPMREVDYKEALKKGERALGVYFDAQHKRWNATMKAEYAIDGVVVGKVPLRGRLDRIDLLGDNRARVVDYKFKKPMSRNQIAGTTKSSDGNYYRQLTFYKLLIDEGTKWQMQDGVLDFLEPDPRGKLKQEVFAPSAKEVSELKKEIERVSAEILDLSFLSKKCDDKECKYCELKQFS